jgi:alkanesulfonate monooxygenase SsuD/methylene tetrahydromethanopterin reductase-like flavin-dependent oxidoreductase (luciferase family)
MAAGSQRRTACAPAVVRAGVVPALLLLSPVSSMKLAVRCHQGGWTWEQVQAVWQEADRSGFDGASLYDLLGAGVECWTALSTLLATTTRLTGIPMVLANPYRAPALTARMAATLDVASRGRLILGLGSGGAPADAHAHGVAWHGAAGRAVRLQEGVQAMRSLWDGDGTFAGRYVQISAPPRIPLPYRRGGPPVLIGGRGQRHLLRTAAAVADYCNMGFDLPPSGYAVYRELLERYCREAGRDPGGVQFTHNASVIIGASGREYELALAHWARQRGLTVAEARERLRFALAGTPDTIAARLDEYRREGFAWVFLVFSDLPALEMLRLFAAHVLPLVDG